MFNTEFVFGTKTRKSILIFIEYNELFLVKISDRLRTIIEYSETVKTFRELHS